MGGGDQQAYVYCGSWWGLHAKQAVACLPIVVQVVERLV